MENKKSHAERAVELFLADYNCAQAVFGAFCDVTGMDFETAMKLSSSFGGGMGRMREVCGAVSAMFMVTGLLYGYGDTGEGGAKAEHYKRIQALADEFKAEHGSIICRELIASLKKDTSPTPEARTEQYYKERPCAAFVRCAAEVMDRLIAETEAKTKEN
ncbi:MAG: C_GCAxxG_C_C family protein [Ruminococcaceae bacterium]|nr:C_GCAxxG_C_C family protein [Oscillospiraceae bacterium]